jgi:hypothetical protein
MKVLVERWECETYVVTVDDRPFGGWSKAEAELVASGVRAALKEGVLKVG